MLIQRMIALEHLQQSGRDPLREDNWGFCADPDQLYMGNPSQVCQKPFQLFVGQDQRIAAGEENIPYLGMRCNIQETSFPQIDVRAVVALVADHP
jgi:hypothetical protein